MATITTPQSQKSEKNDRDKFGKNGQPIPATKVYKKQVDNFSDQKTQVVSWMLINDNTGTITFVNTYDGRAGRKFDVAAATRPIGEVNEQEQKKRLKNYSEVEISDCPVAIPA